ncbi:MAG TPA: Hsp20/alpha crystallin family protein [Steroidobacteraceae bacterium]|nr:Hsp20/alpha crystallin family protein [Steroidobacteraceae bacterium]
MWNTLFGESTTLFDEFNWLSREMDRLFEPMGIPALRKAGAGFPAVNVATEEDKVHVLFFAPGIDPATLEVSMLGNVLTVKGHRDVPEAPEGTQTWVRERPSGRFVRTLTLPDDVDSQRVEAQSRDGLVWIQVMRNEAARPRRIQVH